MPERYHFSRIEKALSTLALEIGKFTEPGKLKIVWHSG